MDGVILQQAIPVDTVTDTPMKSYTTLVNGENGNLTATLSFIGTPSYAGEAGTVYYLERDGQALVQTGPVSLQARPSPTSQEFYTYNFGQQPWEDVGPQGDQQELYQTWEQYAQTTLGYALQRIADLERLRLEDAETIATLRADVTNALSRIASIESDEVNDDAVDNSLITLVGSLSSQITIWQTRIETAETALAAAVERITTLENN